MSDAAVLERRSERACLKAAKLCETSSGPEEVVEVEGIVWGRVFIFFSRCSFCDGGCLLDGDCRRRKEDSRYL